MEEDAIISAKYSGYNLEWEAQRKELDNYQTLIYGWQLKVLNLISLADGIRNWFQNPKLWPLLLVILVYLWKGDKHFGGLKDFILKCDGSSVYL